MRLFGLENTFEFGELEFVVHAGGEVGGAYLDGMNFNTVGNGFGDEVGFLGGVGVFFFDDGGYAAVAVADDTAQACRVGGNVGQQTDFAACGFE